MSIDFSSMTPKALAKFIAEATREHKRKKKRAPIMQVRNKLSRMAKNEGYTIQELFGANNATSPATSAAAKPGRRKAKATTGRKVPPKYRNPSDLSQTWTGRGKAPLWFVALIDSGKTRDDLLIRD
ncbi:H-NS histone family protein [Xanthomonadaceae bacterium JHOS43]|nr:H-NS histone family protein [Xanthomonadaceae bacterium JHOS43]MCX7562851.1 H-NS histone family protein [Xanthomonadaceae bacterium XH05]